MNVAGIIDAHDEASTALTVVREGSVVDTVSYGALRHRVAAMRARLTEMLDVGDRLVLVGDNDPEFVSAFLGAVGIGAIAVPVNPVSPPAELRRKLAAVDPSAIAVSGIGTWALEPEHDFGLPVIDVGQVPADGADAAPPIFDAEPDYLATLLLTSGVSASPKAAMLTHANLDWMQTALLEMGEHGLSADDRIMSALPLSHIFGLNVVLLAGLRAGGNVFLVDHFSARQTVALIREHALTQIVAVPPMWNAWLATDAPNDSFASVRRAASGAASLPIETFNAVRDRFGLEIGEGYGLTETSPVVTTSRAVDPRPGSVGVVLPGVEVRIVEDDGTDVEPGDTGEILVKSPGVFAGYWEDEEATLRALPGDGWFRTGDVGAFDDDGYLYLVDRIKDLIIVSGFNVYPAEIEDVLLSHPDVDGAIVVGVADERTGEAIEAYVRGSATVEDLRHFLDGEIPRYKIPSAIHLVDELPVASSGKLIRRELR